MVHINIIKLLSLQLSRNGHNPAGFLLPEISAMDGDNRLAFINLL